VDNSDAGSELSSRSALRARLPSALRAPPRRLRRRPKRGLRPLGKCLAKGQKAFTWLARQSRAGATPTRAAPFQGHRGSERP